MKFYSDRLIKLVLLCSLSFLYACKLSVDIDGSGTVQTNISPVVCIASDTTLCWNFPLAQEVTLTPTANNGYEFVGWKGDCSGMGYCTVDMRDDHYVEAEFLPVTSLQITNIDADLNKVLEHGQLQGSCDRYYDDPENASEYLRLMCGKWMFFYEGFDLGGIPTPMVDLLLTYAPNAMGESFANFGMIADPFAKNSLPLGLVNGQTLNGVDSIAFGCASCHFAQTPDGRYSVGAANHDYDYGKQIISFIYVAFEAMLPEFASPLLIHPDVKAYVKPQADELLSNASFFDLSFSMLPVLSLFLGDTVIDFPLPSQEKQTQYLSWKPGTQDFVIDPAGLDDEVHTVSKISPLWDLYTPEDMIEHGGSGSTFYGFTGSTPDIETFLRGFVALSWGSDQFDDARLKPLRDYLLTLKAPSTLESLNSDSVDNGQQLFVQEGCAGCHNGPSFAGTELYDYADIGTDEAMMRWGDHDLNGIAEQVPQLFSDGAAITHKLKATKLTGLWAQSLFLHNGSVDSLEDLLCLDHARPTITELVFSDKGHLMGCDLSRTDKLDLINYLKTL